MRKYINRIINDPLFSGSTIMILGSNGASAINYLYHLVIGRLLGPSLYGELAALISVMGLLGIIPGAFNLVIVKEISSIKNNEDLNNLILWFRKKIFLVSIISSIAVLLLSPAISSFLHISDISYLIIIALFFLFSLQTLVNRSILQGLLRFQEMVMSVLIENGSKLLLSLLLIYLGFQVRGAMFAFLLSIVFGFYVTNNYLKVGSLKNINISPDINSMLKFAFPVIIQIIALTSLYTSDVILIKHFFSSHEAGIYAALSTLGKIILFGAGPISSVMFPLVSQRKVRGENYEIIFIYSFVITLLLSLGGIVIYWLFPKFIIGLLYGSAYLGSEHLLVWFALFISLFTLSSLLITYNFSLGKTKVTFLPLIAAIAQIGLIILFHQSLFSVILISSSITALLLLSLLIYSTYDAGVS